MCAVSSLFAQSVRLRELFPSFVGAFFSAPRVPSSFTSLSAATDERRALRTMAVTSFKDAFSKAAGMLLDSDQVSKLEAKWQGSSSKENVIKTLMAADADADCAISFDMLSRVAQIAAGLKGTTIELQRPGGSSGSGDPSNGDDNGNDDNPPQENNDSEVIVVNAAGGAGKKRPLSKDVDPSKRRKNMDNVDFLADLSGNTLGRGDSGTATSSNAALSDLLGDPDTCDPYSGGTGSGASYPAGDVRSLPKSRAYPKSALLLYRAGVTTVELTAALSKSALEALGREIKDQPDAIAVLAGCSVIAGEAALLTKDAAKEELWRSSFTDLLSSEGPSYLAGLDLQKLTSAKRSVGEKRPFTANLGDCSDPTEALKTGLCIGLITKAQVNELSSRCSSASVVLGPAKSAQIILDGLSNTCLSLTPATSGEEVVSRIQRGIDAGIADAALSAAQMKGGGKKGSSKGGTGGGGKQPKRGGKQGVRPKRQSDNSTWNNTWDTWGGSSNGWGGGGWGNSGGGGWGSGGNPNDKGKGGGQQKLRQFCFDHILGHCASDTSKCPKRKSHIAANDLTDAEKQFMCSRVGTDECKSALGL